jgi:hypothetical protein
MHAAAPLAAHRRRAARAAGTGFGAATPARLHRSDIASVVAHACASLIDGSIRSQMTQFGYFAHMVELPVPPEASTRSLFVGLFMV